MQTARGGESHLHSLITPQNDAWVKISSFEGQQEKETKQNTERILKSLEEWKEDRSYS